VGYQVLTMGGRFERKVPVAGRRGHASERARRAREEMRAAVGRVRAEAAAALLDVNEAPSAQAGDAPSRVARQGVAFGRSVRR
jgi:hypothetical protein